MNTPLKPCPFCGSQPAYFAHKVYCPTKRCAAGEHVVEVAAWNTRSNTPESSAAQGAITVTDEMVKAYLSANDKYWHESDAMPRTSPSKFRNGTPTEATRVSLEAALAAQPSDANAQPIHPDPMEVLRDDCAALREENRRLTTLPRVYLTDERAALRLAIYWLERCWCSGEHHARMTFIEHIRELLANTAQGKPDHIVDANNMVPIEASKKMIDAAVAFALNVSLHGGYGWSEYMRDLYRTMMAAHHNEMKG